MTRGTRRLAARPSKKRLIAVVAAPLATVAVIGAGVTLTSLPTSTLSLAERSSTHASTSIGQAAGSLAGRQQQAISRDFDRTALAGATALPKPVVTSTLWATGDLLIRATPAKDAQSFGEIAEGKQVRVTGVHVGDYAQIVVGDTARWVTASYLAKDKPVVAKGLDFSPCGPSLPGIVPDMRKAYYAVCNAFPQVKTYGGMGAREEHNTGHAVDAMVYGDRALGQQIADFLHAHAAELNLYDIIWYQHIWTPVRASEGWRQMPNRGSATANHMDHVHFGVN